MIFYTPIVKFSLTNDQKWKNEKNLIYKLYYYSFPIILQNCQPGQSLLKENQLYFFNGKYSLDGIECFDCPLGAYCPQGILTISSGLLYFTSCKNIF